MVEIGKHLWRWSSPTHCSKEGQLESVAQILVLSNSEYLQRWRLQNLSWQAVPSVFLSVRVPRVFDHSHSEKGFFSCLSGISCISTGNCCPVTEHCWEKPSSVTLSQETPNFSSMLSDMCWLSPLVNWKALLSFLLSQKHLINILVIFATGFRSLRYLDFQEWNSPATNLFLYCSYDWLLLITFIFLLHFTKPILFVNNQSITHNVLCERFM